MAVKETTLFMQAHYPDGRPVDSDEFVNGLGVSIAPYSRYGAAGQWSAVGLQIGTVQISSFEEFGTERYEEYEKAVQKSLLAFAGWLAAIPTKDMQRLMADGLNVRLLMTLQMDQDQMEVNIPPELSSQLGRLGMGFYMLSNE
ncbi:MAG TPA: hypothetical protein VG269_12330 [Tepidisphaeraceae bacterium]|jgi:hypothetical protein|nr:hypothetical protein [Tepidisphaeraceae bacterium]